MRMASKRTRRCGLSLTGARGRFCVLLAAAAGMSVLWAAMNAASAGASARAAAAQTAKQVKITIQHDSSIPDFDGFLLTSSKCGNGTKVTVYKQKGNSPRPSQDKKIGFDIAEPNGDGYQWFVHTHQNQGTFYAHTNAKPGCAAGFSKSITLH